MCVCVHFSCKQGWLGANCDQCVAKTGCGEFPFETISFFCVSRCWDVFRCSHAVNGYCTVPNECICSSNWGGANCDVGECNVKFIYGLYLVTTDFIWGSSVCIDLIYECILYCFSVTASNHLTINPKDGKKVFSWGPDLSSSSPSRT